MRQRRSGIGLAGIVLGAIAGIAIWKMMKPCGCSAMPVTATGQSFAAYRPVKIYRWTPPPPPPPPRKPPVQIKIWGYPKRR